MLLLESVSCGLHWMNEMYGNLPHLEKPYTMIFYILCVIKLLAEVNIIEILHASLLHTSDSSLPDNVGVGGYKYLLEPLWWAGMVTSK